MNKKKNRIRIAVVVSAGLLSLLSFQRAIVANAKEVIPEKKEANVTPVQDIYGIGSISKMYTTAAVMKLWQEGLVDLDTPVTTYIPDFTMADSRYQQITPRMLLNHTSGLMGTTWHDAFTFGASDTRYHDNILEELRVQTLKADPGSYGVYCNDGFTLAELLIERVTGMGYTEYLSKTFFEPMGIKDTFTTVYGFEEDRLAPSYTNSMVLPYVDCHLIGSGGIFSTASDVAAFGQLFTDRNIGILSGESLAAMSESNSQMDDFGYVEGDKQFDYGLGWDCVDTYPYSAYGVKALSKGGSVILQNSALVVLPEENISASMIVSGGSGDEASYALQDLILEILEEEGIIDEKKDLTVETDIETDAKPLPEEMKKYAGYYLSNQLLKASFDEDGTLLLEGIGDDYDIVQEYSYIGDGKFAPRNGYYLSHSGEMTYNSNGNKGYGTLFFREESNGKTYLAGNSHETIYELGENAMSLVFAEKIEPARVAQSCLEAWKKRDGKKYFLTNSVYNAWDYYSQGILELQGSKEIEGYVQTTKQTDTAQILDENHARSLIDLPVMLGRDLASYTFSKKALGEELQYASLTYVSEEQVESIAQLPRELTMKKSEEVHWYRIGKEQANSSLTIEVPKEGAYYLYDKDGSCIASSIILSEKSTVLLPENGYLAFAGEPGNTFHTVQSN